MRNFTINDLSELLKNEQNIINQMSNSMEMNVMNAPVPNVNAVNAVMAYAQSLSVKKTEKLGPIRLMLN